MSEKRFELLNGIITDMQDNERMYGIFELVDKLNELSEENEQLRQRNQELNDNLQEAMGKMGLLNGVKEENEQLKWQCKRLKQMIE